MKLAVIAALPALFAVSPTSAQVTTPYKALGTEPFWSLTIDRDTITYRPIEGRGFTVRKPRPAIDLNGERYRARGLVVSITHRPCSDGMSDRSYADTVRVIVGRRTLSGCGGAVLSNGENRIAGTRWTIDEIDGRRVRLIRPGTVNFTGDRIEGRICNGYGGSYRLNRGTLIARHIVATKMACPGELMRVETRLFALLENPLRMRWMGRDTLVLDGARGTVTLRRAR